jgi:zinc protease
MRYEYYGYPYDYPQKMIEGIKKVTKEDVLRVAKEHLFPDRMTILVVGNPERFDAPLPVGTNIINLTP